MFIDLFPTVIFQKNLIDISNQEINDYVKCVYTEEKVEEYNNKGYTTFNQQLVNLPIFSKLKNNILIYSKLYFKELGYKEFDIQIACSWGNVVDTNHDIQEHYHTNSFLSGCFYPTDNPSPISFNNHIDDKWTFFDVKEHKPNKHRTWGSFKYFPKKKDILLFPSWLRHKVIQSKEDGRVTIAFNVIPKGEFGDLANKIYF